MHLRAVQASPRGSLALNPAAGNGVRVGGSDDDILGLGNLFLPRGTSEAAAVPPPPASGHSIGGGGGIGMPLVAGLTGYRSAIDNERADLASSAHHPTNLSLTDDIKSALRIGEADPAVAAARRSAAMEAASDAASAALFRPMEVQQPLQQLQQRPLRPPPQFPQIGTAPRTAVRLTATNLRAGGTTLPTGLALGPSVVFPEPMGRQGGARMPANPNLPSPPQ